jgi:tRNA threonylcarbamoyladenosine biosynthesis protein TsaB
MNILALETSTEYLSLAVGRGDVVVARHIHAGQRHAERVFEEIRGIVAEAGLALADLDAVAFGRGPGSFTGVRVCCGVTQGLAFSLGIPVKGVVTLEAVAEEVHAATGATQVIVCLDARMGEVYHAAYTRNVGAPDGGGWTTVMEPGVYRPEDVPEMSGEGWVGAGSGFVTYGDILAKRYLANTNLFHPECVPTARAVLALARPALEAGKGETPAEALPLYVRDKVALTRSERAARTA